MQRQGTTYHDVDDDFRIDELSVQLGVREASDGKRRVDNIHYCLGVITSGAPTSREVVYNATICDTEGLLGGLKFVSRFIDGDVAHEEPQQDVIELVGSRNIASEKTRAVPPVVIQHHLAKGVGLFKLRRLGVFMVDSGLVTCLDPVAKRVAWRVETDAGFTPQQLDESEVSLVMHSEEEKENRLRRFPHLAPYSFHHHDPRVFSKREMYHRTDPFVLAVGDQSLVAISGRDGSIAAHVQLPEAPVAPVIVAVFNGDGTNDILVVTASSYFGFVVSQRGSTTTIPLLMLLMKRAGVRTFSTSLKLHITSQATRYEFISRLIIFLVTLSPFVVLLAKIQKHERSSNKWRKWGRAARLKRHAKCHKDHRRRAQCSLRRPSRLKLAQSSSAARR